MEYIHLKIYSSKNLKAPFFEKDSLNPYPDRIKNIATPVPPKGVAYLI